MVPQSVIYLAVQYWYSSSYGGIGLDELDVNVPTNQCTHNQEPPDSP